MQVYILATEADTGVAEELETFLKRHGCMVRIAFDAAMFHPARPGEMTIGLWSLKTRMSAHQITFTNRAIDALVEGGLVVGQLDFHPLPFGLADVTPFDLRVPGMRNMRFQQMLAELRKVQRARVHSNEAAPPASVYSDEIDSQNDGLGLSSTPPPLLTAGNTTDIFISYAFANKEVVWPLVEEVQSEGTNIWIDKDDLKPGANWAGDIVRAIKSTRLFCLMCSSESYASDNVRREVYLADKYDKPILPVLLDGALMPEDIEFFLIDRQWLDITGDDHTKRAKTLREAIAA